MPIIGDDVGEIIGVDIGLAAVVLEGVGTAKDIVEIDKGELKVLQRSERDIKMV